MISAPQALFIGQAPPRGEVIIPFDRTLLYKWLETIGISKEEAQDRFAFTALMDTFPGLKGASHRPPTPQEIAQNHPRLKKLVQETHPAVIVTVGVLSIRTLLGNDKLQLEQVIGQRFVLQPWGDPQLAPRVIIPLPHPSGASTWIYQHNHQELLHRALDLLRLELPAAA